MTLIPGNFYWIAGAWWYFDGLTLYAHDYYLSAI